MIGDLFLVADEACDAIRDFNGDLVTIFNYDNVFHDDPDPFHADDPDMTGVCE